MTEKVQKFGGAFRPFALLLMCALVAASVAWGGFREGKDAYDRGDYATALAEFQPVATQGHAEGQYQLGVMYYYGYGVKEDDAEAVKWFQKAADQGHAMAQNHLGDMYYFGYGIAEDDAEAVKWFQKAAAQGYAEALFNLGVMYTKGFGVAKDDAEALKWFRKAAEEGHDAAQFSLGAMYSDGHGEAEKDTDEAMKWFRRAAAQGYAKAQYLLGYMHENGTEVPKDLVEAHRWYALAEARGEIIAGYKRAELAEKLTDAQLAEAKRKARDGLQAEDFTLWTPAGERFKLSENVGKPIFLNFWTTWCPPCIAEMPDMEKLKQTLGDSVQIVGINLQESPATVRRFIQNRGFTWTFLLDPRREVGNAYNVKGIPVSLFLDTKGSIVHRFNGARDYETFLEAARQAMGKATLEERR